MMEMDEGEYLNLEKLLPDKLTLRSSCLQMMVISLKPMWYPTQRWVAYCLIGTKGELRKR